MDRLLENMVAKNISIIECNDLLYNASLIDKPDHAIFKFKVEEQNFVGNEKISRELGAEYIPLRNLVIVEKDV